MRKNFFVITIILLLTVFILPVFMPEKTPYLSSFQLIITSLITLLIPFLLLTLIFVAWITGHLYVKLEQMNIGGINLLFDKPDEIFINNSRSFLETKRTLFKVDSKLDNFNETLDSYFSVYQFFKKEMTILDIKKREQKELYDLSSKIITELNLFLTAYQNNYRRWYQRTIDDNVVLSLSENSKEEVKKDAHMMKIGELQEYYYDYENILKGFESINDFFKEEVNPIIKVDIKKWEDE